MTTTDALYAEVKPDIAAIANPLFDFSEQCLRKNGNFLPHAAVLTEAGEVRLVAADPGSERTNSTEVLPLLHGGLRAQAETLPLKAIGVAENVTVTLDGQRSTMAIKVLLSTSGALLLRYICRLRKNYLKDTSLEKRSRFLQIQKLKRGHQMRPNPAVERGTATSCACGSLRFAPAAPHLYVERLLSPICNGRSWPGISVRGRTRKLTPTECRTERPLAQTTASASRPGAGIGLAVAKPPLRLRCSAGSVKPDKLSRVDWKVVTRPTQPSHLSVVTLVKFVEPVTGVYASSNMPFRIDFRHLLRMPCVFF